MSSARTRSVVAELRQSLGPTGACGYEFAPGPCKTTFLGSLANLFSAFITSTHRHSATDGAPIISISDN